MPVSAKIMLGGVVIALVAAAGVWRLETARATPEALTLYGNVDIRQVDLAFNAEGPLLRLYKEEGDGVKAGELLAELEPDVYQHLQSLAAARLAGDQAMLAKAIAGNRPEDIQKAEADADAARAARVNAEIAFRRAAALLSTAAGTQQAYDNAKAQMDATRANEVSADKTAEVMRLGSRPEDVDAARATVAADEAALALARHRLADTKLWAPSDGIVLTRISEPGTVLGPTSPVYTLSLNQQIWIRSFVPESALGQIKPGAAVEITTDSRAGRPFHGWVGYIAPTAEFTPKTVETPELRTQLVYRVRLFIKDPDETLRQGMPVTIKVSPSASGAALG